MIKSMTGYGKAVCDVDGRIISVEIKSVNHRYFDFTAKMPRQYAFLEKNLKSLVNSRIARGKVDVFVNIENTNDGSTQVILNKAVADAYVKAYDEICSVYKISRNYSASDIAKIPDVLTVADIQEDEDEIWAAVEQTAVQALDKFVEMRAVEGKKLQEDILSKCDYIIECVEYIEKRSPETVREYNDRLIENVHNLLGDVTVDESRILQEVAIYADKVAVDEETVRLRSHVSQLRSLLSSDESVGRKMDFLIQEFNREANTIGSKACDVDVARKVVEIKTTIEKIREQIQNIE